MRWKGGHWTINFTGTHWFYYNFLPFDGLKTLGILIESYSFGLNYQCPIFSTNNCKLQKRFNDLGDVKKILYPYGSLKNISLCICPSVNQRSNAIIFMRAEGFARGVREQLQTTREVLFYCQEGWYNPPKVHSIRRYMVGGESRGHRLLALGV